MYNEQFRKEMKLYNICFEEYGDVFTEEDMRKLFGVTCLLTGVMPTVLPGLLTETIQLLPSFDSKLASQLLFFEGRPANLRSEVFAAAAAYLATLTAIHARMEKEGLTRWNPPSIK